MGKNLIQQARGKGSPRYKAPSFKWKAKVEHIPWSEELKTGEIVELIHCAGHSAPLMKIVYDDTENYMLAPLGVRVGDKIMSGKGAEIALGNTLPLGEIPEGTPIYNIEVKPGDGGKLIRASGISARVISKVPDGVIVVMPSKKRKIFNMKCRATIGIIAGGGREEKPLLKAGNKHHKKKAKNKIYPKVSGVSMNAVDHPFGGKHSHKKGRPTQVPHNAPPGRKVGMLRPRKTGRGVVSFKKGGGGSKKSKVSKKEEKAKRKEKRKSKMQVRV